MFYKKIISLIDCIVSKESLELTIEDLQKYGIKELDINIFIELKHITVKSPDTWHVRIFNIYEYAKNLRKEGSLDEALEVFTRLKKKYIDSRCNHQIYKIYILRKDFEKAAELINNSKRFNYDISVYLLSQIIPLNIPNQNLKKPKILPSELNNIFELCSNKKFKAAEVSIDELVLKYPNRSSYLVLKILLKEINLNIARKEKLLENVDSFPIDQKSQKFLEKENKEFSGLKNIEFVIKFHLVYSCSIDEAAF